MKYVSSRLSIAIIALFVIQGESHVANARAFRALLEPAAVALPAGQIGEAYEYQLQTEGGLPPYNWKVADGELPPGISLEGSGKLMGVPTAARRQAFGFVIKVMDSSQPARAYEQPFLLLIQAAPLRIVTTPQALRIVAPAQSESSQSTVPAAQNPPEGKIAQSANSHSARPLSTSFAAAQVPTSSSQHRRASNGGAAQNQAAGGNQNQGAGGNQNQGAAQGAAQSPAAAEELAVPIIDNLISWTEAASSHARVEGRATAGKTVKFIFKRGSSLTPDETKTTTASDDGTFVYEETESEANQIKSVRVQLVDGENVSKLSALSECINPKRAFLVGLAPFGLVTSQQSEQFSQSDPFGGFIIGNVWPIGRYKMDYGRTTSSLNLRFQVLMQPEARTAMAQATPTTATTAQAEASTPMTTFLSSRKSLDIEGHMWWEYALNPVVSVGPYFAIGGSTVLNKNELVGEDVSVGQGQDRTKLDTTHLITTNDMKKYYEYGLVLDFFSGRKADANLYIQAILAKGWYEAMANLDQHGNDTRNRFVGKLRVFPFGLNRSFFARGTIAPMFGVDLNAGRGQDFARVFVGMAFNITKFLNKANEALP